MSARPAEGSSAGSAAWAVRRFAAVAVAVVVTIGAAAGWVLTACLRTDVAPLAGVYAGVVLVTVVSVVASLVRRRAPELPIVRVGYDDAPPLHALITETAARLAVPCPPVALSPDADLWLDLRSEGPVLMIGAPLLWHLDSASLQRLAAPAIAETRLLEDPRIRAAFRWRQRATAGAIIADKAVPGLGMRTLFRWALGGIDRRVGVLTGACIDQAGRTAASVGLIRTETDLQEAAITAEAWEMLLQRWAVPAWRRGAAPSRLLLGLLGLVDRLENDDAIVRSLPRPTGLPVALLLADAAPGLDTRVSRLAADRFRDDTVALEWSRYLPDVVDPAEREQTRALFAAVNRALGESVPATPQALLETFEQGWGPTIGAILTPRPAEDSGEDDRDPARHGLADHVRAALATAAVDSRAATRTMDWAAGVVLVDRAGEPLPVDQVAADLLDGDAAGAREALIRWRIALHEPLWLGLPGPSRHSYPRYVALAVRHWRTLHLAVTDDRLLLLHDRWVYWGYGALAARQREAIATPVAQLDDRYRLIDEIRFDDLVSARFSARRSGAKWRCRLRAADRVVRLSGLGSGADLVAILAGELGDRLRVRGPVGNDAADPGGWGVGATYTARIGAGFAVVGAILLGVTSMGTPQLATVLDCTLDDPEGPTDESTCLVSVAVDGHAEQASIGAPTYIPPGYGVRVNVTPMPLGGPITTLPAETNPMGVIVLIFGIIMVGGSAPFLLIRRRRRSALPVAPTSARTSSRRTSH